MLKDDDKAAMTEEIHREAERLFKLIGEAYNVLSNPSKVRRPVRECVRLGF
jgi:curved DNA-binding protein CbpA